MFQIHIYCENIIVIEKYLNPDLQSSQSQKRQLDKEIQKKEPIKVKILFD
jgi:hypothetical protein